MQTIKLFRCKVLLSKPFDCIFYINYSWKGFPQKNPCYCRPEHKHSSWSYHLIFGMTSPIYQPTANEVIISDRLHSMYPMCICFRRITLSKQTHTAKHQQLLSTPRGSSLWEHLEQAGLLPPLKKQMTQHMPQKARASPCKFHQQI